MVPKSFIEIRVDKETGKRYEWLNDPQDKILPGHKVNCCPFCDSRTHDGSWTPETCTECGAVYFFNALSRDIK